MARRLQARNPLAELLSLQQHLRNLHSRNSSGGDHSLRTKGRHDLRMWTKCVIAGFMARMIAGPLHFKAIRNRKLLASAARNGSVVRLMTWNIGHDDQSRDSRAHTADLKAIAEVINNNQPDAVALQELANPEQLKTLLSLLHRRYT